MKRRPLLVTIALLLIAGNAAFFLLKPATAVVEQSNRNAEVDVEEVAANWVAFMPDVEMSQRLDPKFYGVHAGPPLNDPVEMIDGRPVLRIAMVAEQCEIDRYAIRNANDIGGVMPERLFAQQLSENQQACLVENLPDGYQLSRLTSPAMPSQVSWSTDLVDLIADESTNAQTH
ncbi:hypothetical protein [Aurantiacibacter luteus]|uniref:hypothetical protein n=1 Tax=Aurantiacibacter luteus TaxID=1581420 RepID=UPI0012E08989|nr:hypothetical protein [Aurantiacibacter luteus]